MPLKIRNSIKYYREKTELSQEQLAEAVGLKRADLSRIESGQLLPTAEEIDQLVEALGVGPHALYFEAVLDFIQGQEGQR